MTWWSVCNVNQAGPAGNGTETPVPVIYINLTNLDTGSTPKFTDQWFYAEDTAKDEMLAVALSAITAGKQVTATYDAPPAGGEPYPQLYRLYLRG